LMPNAQLTGKKWLAKISERSEQKANCFLSLFNYLLGELLGTKRFKKNSIQINVVSTLLVLARKASFLDIHLEYIASALLAEGLFCLP
jgi:hypothetical protein